jgi:hypothetical protein
MSALVAELLGQYIKYQKIRLQLQLDRCVDWVFHSFNDSTPCALLPHDHFATAVKRCARCAPRGIGSRREACVRHEAVKFVDGVK